MLYWMCDKSGLQPTLPQLVHAIKRNFGGLNDKHLDPLNEFQKNLPKMVAPPLDIPQEVCIGIIILCSHKCADYLDLICCIIIATGNNQS